MKYSFAAALLVLPLALAKSVIVTYPKGTPKSVITEGEKSVVDSGGVITHEYSLINGFAADAPDNALESLSTQHAQYKPEIEEDKVVTANGDYAAAS